MTKKEIAINAGAVSFTCVFQTFAECFSGTGDTAINQTAKGMLSRSLHSIIGETGRTKSIKKEKIDAMMTSAKMNAKIQ